MPAAIRQRDKISDEVSEVEAALKPDIVRIRYSVGEAWKDQWSIFFKIVLSGDAAKNRLSQGPGEFLVIDHVERPSEN